MTTQDGDPRHNPGPACLYTVDAPGRLIDGLLDWRGVVSSLRWPDVRGLRCLDLCPATGYFSFELEARGAAEVVALELTDVAAWDAAPVHAGERGSPDPDAFAWAAQALGSRVRYTSTTIAEVLPDTLGTFDVVVFSGARTSLRARLGVLAAAARVCDGLVVSVQPVDLAATALSRRRAAFAMSAALGRDGEGWILPNSAGNRWMVETSGLAVVQAARPVLVPYGPAGGPRWTPRLLADAGLQRLVRRQVDRPLARGVAHSWITARRA